MDFSTAQTWLQAHQDELLETLIAWSNINSGSYHVAGLQQQAEAIVPIYEPWVDDISLHELPPFTCINDHGQSEEVEAGPLISMKHHASAPKQILLSGHIDTVFSPEDNFQKASLQGKKLHGPGVADMKGGLIVMYAALRALQETDAADKLGWEIILNPDEEIGSFSSREKLIAAAKNKDFGLVFEPALDEQGTLVGARKGSSKITLTIRGKSAHAGRNFDEGANAIVAMAQVVQSLHILNHQREGFILNIGQITGGTAVNIVPDMAIVRVNIRYDAKEDLDWFKNELESISLHWKGEENYHLTIHGQASREPKPFEAGNAKLIEQVVATSGELGHAISYRASGGVSDGNILWQAGLANVDTLGVCGGGLHSDQEYMIVSSLIERAELTAKLLYNYAQGEWNL